MSATMPEPKSRAQGNLETAASADELNDRAQASLAAVPARDPGVPEWVDRVMLARDTYWRAYRYVNGDLLAKDDPTVEPVVQVLADFVYTETVGRIALGWSFIYDLDVHKIEMDQVRRAARERWPAGVRSPEARGAWVEPTKLEHLHGRLRRAAERITAEQISRHAFAVDGGADEFAYFLPHHLEKGNTLLLDEDRETAVDLYAEQEQARALQDSAARRADLVERWKAEREFWGVVDAP